VYVDPGTDEPGRFVHLPWNGQPTAIAKPNDYFEFPITEDGRLSQTVIVRVYGAVEDPSAGFIWENNYVITQDDYIDYLPRSCSNSRIAALAVGDSEGPSHAPCGRLECIGVSFGGVMGCVGDVWEAEWRCGRGLSAG
jgi:hypothetical protein